VELGRQFPQYEGSEGLAGYKPGQDGWDKYSLAHGYGRTDEDPGNHWGRPDVALVPISSLLKYREVDREGKDSHGEVSTRSIDSITQDLKTGGVKAMREPLYLLYSHKSRWGYLGEGHHRLIAAQRAGLTHVPLKVLRGEGDATSNMHEGKGAPLHLDNRLVEEQSGYYPGMLHPGNFKEFEGAR
jgi:hypothetical protein